MKVFSKTHQGMVRKNNEDYLLTHEFGDGAIFAVLCDGIGGQVAGDVASKTACEEMISNFSEKYRENMESSGIKNLITSAATRANVIVHELQRKDESLKGMGCTIVATLIRPDIIATVHAGDSRLYIFKDGKQEFLTKNHTMAQMLIDEGKADASDEEMLNHNIITRAVGVNLTIDLDYNEYYPQGEEAVMLCSDGLYRYFEDSEIEKLIYEQNAEEKFIDLANERGGNDNITVVIIK